MTKGRALLDDIELDERNQYRAEGIGILHRAFHATAESRRESQPHVLTTGTVLTWDGRLDNRDDLVEQLSARITRSSPDLHIVAAAYEAWGTSCFARMVGDWALSAWNPKERRLILARDFVGARHLFYCHERDYIAWSTLLGPLVALSDRTFQLDEEYIAGWLSFFPAADITPYVGIRSVPPSCFVRVTETGVSINQHWDFDPSKRIRYRSDQDYEEHFRTLLFESVRRRLRSDRPVLAELSGGMDSSAIVCVADKLIHESNGRACRLETISYFDDSEPNWNERPYFETTERKRGRAGRHIDVGSHENLVLRYEGKHLAATPASSVGDTACQADFRSCLAELGSRVVLSGIGGDEVLGGVPTPIPELGDLLMRGHVFDLFRQLSDWGLTTRKPVFQLMRETIREFSPLAGICVSRNEGLLPWLKQPFVERNRRALEGYHDGLRPFGPLPSFQLNLQVLNGLRRQLHCVPSSLDPPYEKRYPYLDRDLLEFLYAIPREQLVRPTQRRSLMRRALRGMVPEQVLNRRRKAFVTRRPRAMVSACWSSLTQISQYLLVSAFGFVEPTTFRSALRNARNGLEVPTGALMRTIALEYWVRYLLERNSWLLHFDVFNQVANKSLERA